MTTATKLKLDIGGGDEPRYGWVNVDLYYPEADVRAPAWDLPYEFESVDAINCSHMLEHVEKRKVIPVLREFHRVLKPAGILAIEVPDLVWCCEHWLSVRNDGWSLDVIFGNQDTPGQFHQTGFTQAILIEDLRKAGFTKDYAFWQPWSHEQRCLAVEIVK